MENIEGQTIVIDAPTFQTPTGDEFVNAPAPDEAPPHGMQMMPGGDVKVLSKGAYKRLKDEAHEKGRKTATMALEEKFRTAGFESMDDALILLNTLKSKSQSQPFQDPPSQPQMGQPQAAQPWQQPSQAAAQAAAQEREKFVKEQEQLLRRLKTEEKARRELQRQVDEKETEIHFRTVAVEAGVKNVRGALYFLREALESKDEAELKAFDERKFFTELRDHQPYLFGEVMRPATTGTGTVSPGAPRSGQVQSQTAQNGMFDARKASREEYAARMAKYGLNPDVT